MPFARFKSSSTYIAINGCLKLEIKHVRRAARNNAEFLQTAGAAGLLLQGQLDVVIQSSADFYPSSIFIHCTTLLGLSQSCNMNIGRPLI